jgi:hypothetical protein
MGRNGRLHNPNQAIPIAAAAAVEETKLAQDRWRKKERGGGIATLLPRQMKWCDYSRRRLQRDRRPHGDFWLGPSVAPLRCDGLHVARC